MQKCSEFFLRKFCISKRQTRKILVFSRFLPAYSPLFLDHVIKKLYNDLVFGENVRFMNLFQSGTHSEDSRGDTLAICLHFSDRSVSYPFRVTNYSGGNYG